MAVFRKRINFGPDFCGDPNCDLCFTNVESREREVPTDRDYNEFVKRETQRPIPNYISRRDRSRGFRNAPKFVTGFYEQAEKLAEKIEKEAAKENQVVEVKITTTIKPKTFDKKALEDTIQKILAAKKVTLNIETVTPVVEKVIKTVEPPAPEITFDMLLNRPAKIEENKAEITKEDVFEIELVSQTYPNNKRTR